MAIVNKKPLLPQTPLPNPPVIHSQPVRTNVVDTKYNPLSSLLTNVEGSKWVIDYYSQIIDSSDALTGQDIGQSGVYQQYKLIKNLEIKVDSDLSTSQDPESKSMTVVGTAHIHSMVIPNNGDVFIADIGEGRPGLFQITNSEKRSISTQSIYLIEYTLIDYADDSRERKKDLDSKVVQTFYYLKDYLNYGQNPLVITSEYDSFLKLHDLQEDLIESYFKWFYSVEKKTLLIPGQPEWVYDHYLTKFVLGLINTDENPKIRHTKVFNVEEDAYLSEPTIFDAILKRDKYLLKTINNKMGLVSKFGFSVDPMMEGFRFANIPYIVYPIVDQPIFKSVTPMVRKIISSTPLQNVPTRSGDLMGILPLNVVLNSTTALPELPEIVPVLQDNFYVFTESFYQNNVVTSQLEWIVHKFLNEQPINASEIYNVSKNFTNWGGLERFYYIPIIIAMIKYVFRST